MSMNKKLNKSLYKNDKINYKKQYSFIKNNLIAFIFIIFFDFEFDFYIN